MGASHVDYLASLEPRGVWRPPLAPDQIAAAIDFGQRFYADADGLMADPYDLALPQVRVYITIATAFGRLAAYGGQCARTGMSPNPTEAEDIVLSSYLAYAFMMRIISKHKIVSILHYRGTEEQGMGDTTRSREGDSYIETCTFPYPTDLAAVQRFELFIPTFLLFGKKANFEFDFGALH